MRSYESVEKAVAHEGDCDTNSSMQTLGEKTREIGYQIKNRNYTDHSIIEI